VLREGLHLTQVMIDAWANFFGGFDARRGRRSGQREGQGCDEEGARHTVSVYAAGSRVTSGWLRRRR
jgi:hypothetical protein